jgi:GTP-binding protein
MKPYVEFLTSAVDAQHFPAAGPPEIAFLGRSNVGKSSLLNSLVGSKIARVSSTPGRTRMINFFAVYPKEKSIVPDFLLVDLPGYGYAKLSKSARAEWPKFIDPYLQERKTLVLCVVLVDVNIPAQPSDLHLLDFLRSTGMAFLVVGTKSDKLSNNQSKNSLQRLSGALAIDSILPYSAKTGAGREELWREVRRVAVGHE